MLLFRKREEYTNDNVSLCLGHCDPLTVSWVSCLETKVLRSRWKRSNSGVSLMQVDGGRVWMLWRNRERKGEREVRWPPSSLSLYLSSLSTAPYLPWHNSYHQRCQHCLLALFCSSTSPPLSRSYPPTNSLASSIEIDSEIWKQDNQSDKRIIIPHAHQALQTFLAIAATLSTNDSVRVLLFSAFSKTISWIACWAS